MDMTELYKLQMADGRFQILGRLIVAHWFDGPASSPRRLARLRLLPALRRPARTPAAEDHRARTPRLRTQRLRLLPRPEDGCWHSHPDNERRARARAARHRAGIREVGVSRRLCGSR